MTADVRARADQKGIAVELAYPDFAPWRFIGDSTRLRQILVHLTGNAIKFTEKGFIRLHCECSLEAGNMAALRLDVADSGIGIDPVMHGIIFKKFSQVDGSLTRRHGGTGLGLAIVKELIELMDGEIGFESRLQAGSLFGLN